MTKINALELYLEGNAEMVGEKKCPKCEDVLVRINLTGDVNINNIMCVNDKCDYRLDLIEGGDKQ